jgi:hypothetical protein
MGPYRAPATSKGPGNGAFSHYGRPGRGRPGRRRKARCHVTTRTRRYTTGTRRYRAQQPHERMSLSPRRRKDTLLDSGQTPQRGFQLRRLPRGVVSRSGFWCSGAGAECAPGRRSAGTPVGRLSRTATRRLAAGLERVAAQERRRHDRIAQVIESTEITGIYEVLDDYDFSSTPRPWPTPGL